MLDDPETWSTYALAFQLGCRLEDVEEMPLIQRQRWPLFLKKWFEPPK